VRVASWCCALWRPLGSLVQHRRLFKDAHLAACIHRLDWNCPGTDGIFRLRAGPGVHRAAAGGQDVHARRVCHVACSSHEVAGPGNPLWVTICVGMPAALAGMATMIMTPPSPGGSSLRCEPDRQWRLRFLLPFPSSPSVSLGGNRAARPFHALVGTDGANMTSQGRRRRQEPASLQESHDPGAYLSSGRE
jgi:hypothetical protein